MNLRLRVQGPGSSLVRPSAPGQPRYHTDAVAWLTTVLRYSLTPMIDNLPSGVIAAGPGEENKEDMCCVCFDGPLASVMTAQNRDRIAVRPACRWTLRCGKAH